MAAATVFQLPEAKSTPDVTKLNAMSSRTVLVTRLFARNVPAQVLITERDVPVDRVLTLHQSEVAKMYGPGTYRFEVVDEGGQEKDVWTARYGSGTGEVVVGTPTTGAGMTASAGALGEGVMDLGNGYRYNPAVGLLVTPKGVFRWSPDQPLPVELGPMMPGFGPATPIGHPHWQMPAGSGAVPADDGLKAQVDALKEELRRRDTLETQRSNERAIERLADGFMKALEATNARIEGLLVKITEKPAGPAPEIVELRAAVTAAEQRAREVEQRARDEAERQRGESTHRADIQRLELLIQSMTANKSDPLIAMILQVLQQQGSFSKEAVEAVKDAAAQSNQQLAGAALTPERLTMLLQQITQGMQNGGSELNRMNMEIITKLFSMQKDMTKQQIELERSGQGPAWAPYVEQGMETLGKVAQAVVAAKSTPQPQQPARPRPITVAAQPVATAPNGAPAQTQVRRQVAAPAPAAAPRTLTPAEQRDELAKKVGNGAPMPDHREELARKVGNVPAAESKPAAPAAQPAAAGASAPAVKRRQRRQAATTAAAGVAAVANAPIDQVRELAKPIADDVFFGSLVGRVGELRGGALMGLKPEQVADYILQGRDYLKGAGEYPPVAELLAAGHVQIIVERLLPEAPAEYAAAVVEALKAKLAAPVAQAAAEPPTEAPPPAPDDGDEGDEDETDEDDDDEGEDEPE